MNDQVNQSQPLATEGDGQSCVAGRELDSKYQMALNLLERASAAFEHGAPDADWFKEYYLLTGEHAVLTDEGWQPGETKHVLDTESILDEVNAPHPTTRKDKKTKNANPS